MSVVNKRERRKNAGQRMGSLLGKAMEEDDTFWSHETWNDDDGEDSDNDSFHESDEDSVLKKDVFDSDFDDSESDNEDDDVAAGEAEELELQKSERARRNQKISTNYVDAKSSTARGNRGRRGASNKRAVGVGFNAGIVLKFPSNSSNSLALLPTPSSISALQLTKPSTTSIQSTISTAAAAAADTKNKTAVNNLPEPSPLPAPVPVPSSQANDVSSSSRKLKNRIVGDPVVRSSRFSLRERRSTHEVRKLRENRSTPSRQSATTTTNTNAAAASTGRSKSSSSGGSNSRTTTTAKRKRHSQEELLLEAIHETEPENQRWLFGRKRTQDQHDKDKDLNSGFRDKYRGRKVIEKFHSRRGCLNTLTFPEMDAVPEILTRRQPHHQQKVQEESLESLPSNVASSSSAEPSQQVSSNICVITGKPGRYKDPITNLPYHNLTAFKELRRRHENGIPILKNNKGSIDGEGTKNNKQVTKKKSTVRETSQGDGDSFSSTATKGDKKPATHYLSKGEKKISANNGKNNKKNAGKKAPPKKSSSPSDAKLPFQSPKPPSRPSFSTAHKQQSQQPYPILPTFSLSRKDSSTTTTTTTAATTTIESPISPSGRRLSPRKWKPSEKKLENICMSPKKDGVIATPRVSSIKPQQLALATGLNMQRLDDKNDRINMTITGSSATYPSSSLSTSVMPIQSDTAVATKILPPPPVKAHSATENNNNSDQKNKKLRKESETNRESSNKKPKTIGKGTTAAFKPKKAVGFQPLPPEDNIKNSSLPTAAATSIAGTSVNTTINSADSNGISQKTTTIATTAPSTGTTKNGSSYDVCTAKIAGNNIRKNNDAVTENTDQNRITSSATGTKGQEIKSKYE
jgi:hypothetical protein